MDQTVAVCSFVCSHALFIHPLYSRDNALRISNQLMDVVIRVPAVRRHGIRSMTDLLITERLLVHNSASNAMSEVLYAAAFLVGEFAEYVEEHVELVTVMLKPQVATLSQNVQNVFVQSFVKVLASALMQPFDVADKVRMMHVFVHTYHAHASSMLVISSVRDIMNAYTCSTVDIVCFCHCHARG